MIHRFVLIALCICLSALVGCARKAPQNSVTVYCSVDQQVAEPILAAFEKETGITVKKRFDAEANKTVGLVEKLRAEKDKPIADIFWSSEIFYTLQLAQEGLLSPYTSPTVEQWPATFKDQQNRWIGLALRGRVIAWNSNHVSDSEAPMSLEDLTDPLWKGRVVMARPLAGTTGGDVASWLTDYGPDRYKDILKQLKANDIDLVDGNSTAVRMITTGQAHVCLTDTDDVYAARRNGANLGMAPLRRNGKGTLTIPNTAAVIAGCPNPETAKRFMEFLLGGTVEQMLLESDSHNWPIGFEPDETYSEYAIPDPLQIDYTKVAENLNSAKLTAREILE